eukprot:1389886-Amphidinium_carterae.1
MPHIVRHAERALAVDHHACSLHPFGGGLPRSRTVLHGLSCSRIELHSRPPIMHSRVGCKGIGKVSEADKQPIAGGLHTATVGTNCLGCGGCCGTHCVNTSATGKSARLPHHN